MYARPSSFSPFDNKAKTASSKINNAGSTHAGNSNTTTNDDNNNNNNNSHVSTVEPFFRFDANDQHAFLEVELPGVTKPDLSVELNGHMMTITAMRYRSTHLLMLKDWPHHRSDSGDVNLTADDNVDENDGDNGDGDDDEHTTDQQEEQHGGEKQKQQTQERNPSFLYSLEMRLASAADVENITCLHFRDGVLTIHIPARRKILPRLLPIP